MPVLTSFEIPDSEVELTAVRAQGAGGQNVNKVSSAVHLRFDIVASSLPATIKERLLNLGDNRISKDGVLILKAQTHRSQERNRNAALHRLHDIVTLAAIVPEIRRATKPTRSSQVRRLDNKTNRGLVKNLRQKVVD